MSRTARNTPYEKEALCTGVQARKYPGRDALKK